MVKANYSAPRVEVRKSGLRASILAGSQVVTGKDLMFARERKGADAEEGETLPFAF